MRRVHSYRPVPLSQVRFHFKISEIANFDGVPCLHLVHARGGHQDGFRVSQGSYSTLEISPPSLMEQAYAIFANVIEFSDDEVPTNAK